MLGPQIFSLHTLQKPVSLAHLPASHLQQVSLCHLQMDIGELLFAPILNKAK
jgi:hypothetical protein